MFCSRRAAGVPQKLAGDVAYNGPFGDSTVLPSSQHGAKVGLTEREAPFGGSPMAPRKLVLTPTGFVNSPSSLLATRALGDVVTRAEQDGGEASAQIPRMPAKSLSQRTIVELMCALRELCGDATGLEVPVNYTEFLYARNFPVWFVTRAENPYHWNWQRILFELRDGRFFHSHDNRASGVHSIPGGCLTEAEAIRWGEHFIQRLAALATQTTLPTGESVLRSLHLDGFAVDSEKLRLVPLEGPVSAREEEDTLARLVQESGIPNIPTVLKHVSDAHFLYLDGKYSSALNESRNLLQALIDAISMGADKHGTYSAKLPDGTANRIEYLTEINFLTADEKGALNSAWGSLCAGSHPGVPEREEARIGLVLALEFGQLLLLKFANWTTHDYRAFS
jgi:hypothetical protein